MGLKSNVALLLLQIVLYRQQELLHMDKTLDNDQLLADPVLDEMILSKFANHRLVRMYAPELSGIQLRTLKGIVRELFEQGLPDDDVPVTVVTLANHFYYTRVQELEREQIPELKAKVQELQNEREQERT
ncbi:Swc7p [Lachancea thermotolerans CBS 6340]|uniref:KLTH0D14168p n=1 Tax=Lachancea thermotolerans (strain ATCC 56472 / CBS 6340 / NRRL Y-8284) TaxID=559295 RepID=C5DFD2_LACTC|nr:KLTH0D14168p [Lachancea thermotolerans CBS 6340]CAR22887.1 KLTH0D14168p [Lachancea thermotolerans CBS 6340]